MFTRKLVTLLSAGTVLVSCSGVAYASTAPAHPMTTKAIFLDNSNMLDVHESLSRPSGMTYQGTAYMPIYYLETALDKLGIQSKWDGNNWNLTCPDYMTPDTSSIQVGSGNKKIYINGTLVKKVVGVADVDPSSGNPTMFMPVWYLIQILKAMNVDASSWDGTVWTLKTDNNLVDAQPQDIVGLVDAYLPTEATSLKDATTLATTDSDLHSMGYVTKQFVQDDSHSTGSTGRESWIQAASSTQGVTAIYPSADWKWKQVSGSATDKKLEVQKVEVVEYSDGKQATVSEDWTWDVVLNSSGLWQVNSVTQNSSELPVAH